MVGRAAKLERLGLAEQVGPAQWTLKLSIEPAPRDLGIRGDIVKTMRRAMTDLGRKARRSQLRASRRRAPLSCAGPTRLVDRDLQDELKARPTPLSTASTGARTISFSPTWR